MRCNIFICKYLLFVNGLDTFVEVIGRLIGRLIGRFIRVQRLREPFSETDYPQRELHTDLHHDTFFNFNPFSCVYFEAASPVAAMKKLGAFGL